MNNNQVVYALESLTKTPSYNFEDNQTPDIIQAILDRKRLELNEQYNQNRLCWEKKEFLILDKFQALKKIEEREYYVSIKENSLIVSEIDDLSFNRVKRKCIFISTLLLLVISFAFGKISNSQLIFIISAITTIATLGSAWLILSIYIKRSRQKIDSAYEELKTRFQFELYEPLKKLHIQLETNPEFLYDEIVKEYKAQKKEVQQKIEEIKSSFEYLFQDFEEKKQLEIESVEAKLNQLPNLNGMVSEIQIEEWKNGLEKQLSELKTSGVTISSEENEVIKLIESSQASIKRISAAITVMVKNKPKIMAAQLFIRDIQSTLQKGVNDEYISNFVCNQSIADAKEKLKGVKETLEKLLKISERFEFKQISTDRESELKPKLHLIP